MNQAEAEEGKAGEDEEAHEFTEEAGDVEADQEAI